MFYALITKLTAERERQCQKSSQTLIQKVLDLPTGLDWFGFYRMYSKKNVTDLCWFKMDSFESKVMAIFVGNEGISNSNSDDCDTHKWAERSKRNIWTQNISKTAMRSLLTIH